MIETQFQNGLIHRKKRGCRGGKKGKGRESKEVSVINYPSWGEINGVREGILNEDKGKLEVQGGAGGKKGAN